MDFLYRNYELLYPGIVLGPLLMLCSYFLRKKRIIARALFGVGLVYFVLGVSLFYKFVSGEKELSRIRQNQEQEKQ
jgi:hypothetical protein